MGFLTQGLLWYFAFLFSIVCHEASHAGAALKLGDSTPEETSQKYRNFIHQSSFMALTRILALFFSLSFLSGCAITFYKAQPVEPSPVIKNSTIGQSRKVQVAFKDQRPNKEGPIIQVYVEERNKMVLKKKDALDYIEQAVLNGLKKKNFNAEKILQENEPQESGKKRTENSQQPAAAIETKAKPSQRIRRLTVEVLALDYSKPKGVLPRQIQADVEVKLTVENAENKFERTFSQSSIKSILLLTKQKDYDKLMKETMIKIIEDIFNDAEFTLFLAWD